MIDQAALVALQLGLGLVGLIVVIIVLVILWAIVSIPVYLAAKIVTGGKASLGSAMGATLLGPIVYIIVLFAVDLFLGVLIGAPAYVWAFILAFVAWLGVYKATFQTGWLGALGIAVLAILVFVILGALMGILFGITFPGIFPKPF